MKPFTFINAVLENETWSSPWLTHQRIMKAFSYQHRIFYFLREYSWDQVKEDFFKKQLPGSGVEYSEGNILQWRPPRYFPRTYASGSLNELLTDLRVAKARHILDRKGWKERILVLWNPAFYPMIGKFKEQLSIFYCHDYYPAFFAPGSPSQEQGVKDLHTMIDQVDLVIASSQKQFEKIQGRRRRHVVLIENGVDFEAYQSLGDSTPPAELQDLPRPLVGYIGRINRKVDLEVLQQVALKRPQWSVLLMGPKTGWDSENERQFQEFLKLPNAHYLPGVPPQDLPRYMKAIDVGLMNYRLEGTWVSYSFPLKQWEYMAAGKPVVSIKLSSLQQFDPLIKFVEGDSQWVAKIEEALATNSPELTQKRIQAAQANSWENKSQMFLEAVLSVLQTKEKLCA